MLTHFPTCVQRYSPLMSDPLPTRTVKVVWKINGKILRKHLKSKHRNV
jgi:hypothetical protein